MSEDVTVKLGQELVRRRLATLAQVRECLMAQDRLKREGTETSFTSVLIARGIIGLEELKVVLSNLSLLKLQCPNCSAQVRITNYNQSNEYFCNRCKGALEFADSEAPPDLPPAPVPSVVSRGSASRSAKRDSSKPDALVGRRIGGCIVRRHLASGGMGSVYEVEQINLGRTLALKVLAPDLAQDESFVRRFLQEARAAAELNHTNIVHINDAGEDQGVFYYTMEYVAGENLSQRLKREQSLTIDEALRICEQAAAALAHAHGKSVIHRDIKPENIMLAQDGTVKLADLGLAKKTMDEQTSTITQAGAILGTPHYMAPEQAKDFRTADHRSDLYSLGVTLYRMLAGVVPFDGTSPIEVMMKAIDGQKRALRELRPDVPAEVEALVDRMMHVDPRRRFKDAGVVRKAIQSLRRHHVVS
ncbi:MAG: serine/threonine-protein kinase [Planctomycetota bacterium]